MTWVETWSDYMTWVETWSDYTSLFYKSWLTQHKKLKTTLHYVWELKREGGEKMKEIIQFLEGKEREGCVTNFVKQWIAIGNNNSLLWK